MSEPSVIAADVSVTYRVYTDGAPRLRSVLTGAQRRSQTEVRAVRNVSFLARRGEAIGLIGHNGSGKSSLLRAVAGLLPTTTGRVFAAAPPVLLGVTGALQYEISGRRNVFLGGTALGISRAQLHERFDEIVDFAGLGDAIDRPLRTYSSGMKARLSFAISTAVTPDVLLIDEALAVGDEEFRRRSDRRIRQLIDEAGTVFIVSHSMASIRQNCSRALWLSGGDLLADGPVEEVVRAYEKSVDL